MEKNIIKAIAKLRDFKIASENLGAFHELLDEIFNDEDRSLALDTLYGIYEKHPDEDGHGLFWTMLHGIESIPDYEDKLIDSVERKPTPFTVMMINRILNAGETMIREKNLIEVLQCAQMSPFADDATKQDVETYLSLHLPDHN